MEFHKIYIVFSTVYLLKWIDEIQWVSWIYPWYKDYYSPFKEQWRIKMDPVNGQDLF